MSLSINYTTKFSFHQLFMNYEDQNLTQSSVLNRGCKHQNFAMWTSKLRNFRTVSGSLKLHTGDSWGKLNHFFGQIQHSGMMTFLH